MTLTKRESEIVTLVADGLRNYEIAQRLGISKRTVETHRFNVHKKWGVHTTGGLIHQAMKSGVIAA